MSLSLENLRCFTEACRHRNFRLAARSVALSPAAFGQRIKQLEDDVGAALFQRTTRSVVPTEAALRMLPYAQHALLAADECTSAGRGLTGHASIDLVLGTRHELGLSWVVPALGTLERTHPHITLHLYFGSGADLVLRVRTLEIDCAVTSTRLTDPKLDSMNLHEEHYVLVGSRRLLKTNPLRSERDAERHTLLDTAPELPLFRYWRDAPGGIDSMRFGRIQRMGTIAAIRRLVLDGRGVAVLPKYFVSKDLKTRRLVPIMPAVQPASDHFRLVFRAGDPRRAHYEALAATLRGIPLR